MSAGVWLRLILRGVALVVRWLRRGAATTPAALADQLPECDLPDGAPWDRRANVRVEGDRLAVDLHGLSVREALAVAARALEVVPKGTRLRLITGHGRDRALGYSELRVALFDALSARRDARIVDPERHRGHRGATDRLGHMDVDAR